MSEQENGVSLVTLLTKCRDDHLPNGFVNADDVFYWDATLSDVEADAIKETQRSRSATDDGHGTS